VIPIGGRAAAWIDRYARKADDPLSFCCGNIPASPILSRRKDAVEYVVHFLGNVPQSILTLRTILAAGASFFAMDDYLNDLTNLSSTVIPSDLAHNAS
jgi:hypothetical protein